MTMSLHGQEENLRSTFQERAVEKRNSKAEFYCEWLTTTKIERDQWNGSDAFPLNIYAQFAASRRRFKTVEHYSYTCRALLERKAGVIYALAGTGKKVSEDETLLGAKSCTCSRILREAKVESPFMFQFLSFLLV